MILARGLSTEQHTQELWLFLATAAAADLWPVRISCMQHTVCAVVKHTLVLKIDRVAAFAVQY